MTLRLTTRLASTLVLLALAAAPAATQLPAADSAAEFKLAATWTPARTSSVAPLRRAIALNLEGASVKQALREIGRLSGIHIAYGDDVLHSDARVSVHVDGMTVGEALAAVLEGTGLDAFVSLSGRAVLVRAIALGDSTQVGTVTGRVTDAKTGQGIAGASVVLAGTRWRATTDEKGAYKLTEVTPGSYTLTASRIGYTRQSQSVTVVTGQEATVDVRLEVSASPLDAVVVTGTLMPTEVKALPTPISVVTGDEIAQKGYQRVDQIFRGDVPGVIAWNQGPYDYYSTIAVRGASTLTDIPSIKTFIDGVEVARADYLTMIDPNSIERIEVTRGPEASTVYGAGALDGVMEIFTKKGRLGLARPEVTGKVSVGGVGGFDGQSTALQTESALSMRGGDTNGSYNLGGSYRHIGEWIQSYHSTDWGASAGGRTIHGPLTLSGFARYSGKTYDDPWITRFRSYTAFSKPSFERDLLSQQTYGITASVQAAPNWLHTLTLGYDQSHRSFYQTQPRFTTPADSLLYVFEDHEARTSLLYHTDLTVRVGAAVGAALTGGINYDVFDGVNAYTAGTTTPTGSLGGSTFARRNVWGNTGYFGQIQLDLAERLFLTGGLRVERNPNFGVNYGTAWSPRVGAAYVVGAGPITVKLRASYGESIRAPGPGERDAIHAQYFQQLANPALAPERQRGADGGIEVYRSKASLRLSYYNQRAINLIQSATIPTPPGTLYTLQYQNVARVKNEGWELEGRLPLGRVQLAATYSVAHSTILELPPSYPAGGYEVGDQILGIPHSSAGFSVTYSPLSHTVLTASMTHIGHWVNTDIAALYGYYYGGQSYRGSGRAYWIDYPTVTKFAVGVSQALTGGVDAFVRAENVGNNLRFELDNYKSPMPRSVIVGANVRY